MGKAKTTLIAAAAAATLAAGSAAATATASSGNHDRNGDLFAVGLANGGTRLVAFETDSPNKVRTIGAVTGLSGDTSLVGIDYRVQDGKLYGVGDNGGIYTLSTKTARATAEARPRLPLDGSSAYGVDFNPAADALRVITAQGVNLRQPFAVPSATVVDTALTRPAVAPATGVVPATGLAGAAYTNNDLDATSATTLFDIDTERDQVTIQAPANSGTTSATGALGVDFATETGFDIYSNVRNGRTVSLSAFAVSNGNLYEIDLLSGAADSAGRLGSRSVTDIAIPLGQR